jgi:hypothetical protein
MITNSYILAYEVRDSPGYENEVEVGSKEDAALFLLHNVVTHMVVWASLTDEDGNELATTEDLI